MIRTFTMCCALLLATAAHASKPEYFTDEIDNEYRSLMKQVTALLPKTDLPLVYLPAFTPFNLLDIHPTKFNHDENMQAFANFNFGVLGSKMLNITRQQLTHLPAVTICKESACTQTRIEQIKQFMTESADEIASLQRNNAVFIIQQSAPHVFRVNNTFYSPTQLITFYPSEKAGFVPSANFQKLSPEEATHELPLANTTAPLREVMARYNVAAIAKINDQSINVIFGGLSDNHWGVVLFHQSTIPVQGEFNHIGLQYETTQKISSDSFYYQTN